jgi:hypothetical protein
MLASRLSSVIHIGLCWLAARRKQLYANAGVNGSIVGLCRELHGRKKALDLS